MGVFSFLDPILDPFIDIVKGFIMLFEFLIFLVINIPPLIEAAFDIFNPTKLINDIIGGSTAAIMLVVRRIGDIFNPRSYLATNPHESMEKQKSKEDLFGATPEVDPKTGKFINPMNTKGKKCLPPTIARMVIMILCPPFAMFLNSGFSAWFPILICSLLTVYCFYFPGLIYATLHLLC